MSQAIQPESSHATQALPVKRKRGRPRKDQSLNRMGVAHVPPGFEGVRENKFRKADKIDNKDGMVGQPVTGVVEASFDAGCLLTVRIGNSHTILRGVVFKPGHYVPVTSVNDVAPNVQMIQRSEINLPLYNQSQSSNPCLHGSSSQLANMVVTKGKSASPTACPLVPSLGARGTVVPVVLQPFSPTNGPPPANQVILDGLPSIGRNGVTMEPLTMLPPDESASSSQFQVATSQQLPSQVKTSDQVPAAIVPIENGSHGEGASLVGQREDAQEVKTTSVLTPGEPLMRSQGSSQSSETPVDNDKSSDGTSHMELDQEISNPQLPSDPKPMNYHGTGRFVELLQALQENFDDQVPSEQAAGSTDSQENENPETNGKDERRDE